jgi:hypothetical protein
MNSINKPEERFNGRLTETIYSVSLTESELMLLKNAINSDYQKTSDELVDLTADLLKDYRVQYLVEEKKSHLTALIVMNSEIAYLLKN